MNVRNIALTASALALGLASTFFVVRAQGPMYDTVTVDLPYSVTVRNTTLDPGHYVIRQAPNAAGSRVLQIFSNDGMKLETSVMTIPALENKTQDKTEVILHHFGNDYYFDKIWIEGKDYGYEFVLPESVKSRQNERAQPVTVSGIYQASPAAADTAAQSNQPAAAPEPAAQETPVAQASTQDLPAAAPPPAQNPAPPSSPDTSSTPDTGASTVPDTGSRDRSMPDTAANWVTMLLSGGLLSGAGMMLRRWTS